MKIDGTIKLIGFMLQLYQGYKGTMFLLNRAQQLKLFCKYIFFLSLSDQECYQLAWFLIKTSYLTLSAKRAPLLVRAKFQVFFRSVEIFQCLGILEKLCYFPTLKHTNTHLFPSFDTLCRKISENFCVIFSNNLEQNFSIPYKITLN